MKSFRIFLALMITALFAVMVSCDKNDMPNIDRNLLAGEWVHTWSKGYVLDSEDPEFGEEWDDQWPAEDADKVTFDADGTGFFIYSSGPEKDLFRWILEGNMLTLSSDEGDIISSTIFSLTDNEFTIEDAEIDGTFEYYALETYSRIK